MTEAYRSLDRALNGMIDLELNKPTDEINCDLLRECADGILRLQPREKYLLSDEKYDSAIRALFRANRIKLSRTAKIILVAAAILLLSIATALGYAQRKYEIFNFGDHGIISTEKQFGKLKEGLTVGYIPEGFIEQQHDKGKYSDIISYVNGEKILMIDKDSAYEKINIDTEFGSIRETNINGKIYYIAGDDENWCSVLWFENTFAYSVSGNLAADEILRIAESVK